MLGTVNGCLKISSVEAFVGPTLRCFLYLCTKRTGRHVETHTDTNKNAHLQRGVARKFSQLLFQRTELEVRRDGIPLDASSDRGLQFVDIVGVVFRIDVELYDSARLKQRK